MSRRQRRRQHARRRLHARRWLYPTSPIVTVTMCTVALSPFATQAIAPRHRPYDSHDDSWPGYSINGYDIDAGTALITHVHEREGLPPTPRPPSSEAIVTAVRYTGGAIIQP